MTISGGPAGGHPWSEEQARAYLEPYAQAFWQDVRDHVRTPVVAAMAGLSANWIIIVLRPRQSPLQERPRSP